MQYINSQYDFCSQKNKQLIIERGISFEDVIAAIQDDRLLDVIKHHNQERYVHQLVYVVNYVYLFPFVRKDEETVFLKTIFPSRKLTRQYLGDVQ